MNIVVIGDGATGTAAVESIRHVDDSCNIVVIANEPNPSYYRAALTNYMLGDVADRQLQAVSPDFYERYKVQRLFGTALSIDVITKMVLCKVDGQEKRVFFDKLIVATGSRPRIPRISSGVFDWTSLPWVRTLRTLVDAKEIYERMEQGKVYSAAIVGGGPLALEWVSVFMKKGIRVHLFLRTKESLMRGTLNAVARDILCARMRQEGVDIHYDEIKDVQADSDGNIQYVVGNSGRFDVDFVGIAIGVVPNSDFLENTGIELSKGYVVTDGYGRTSEHDIYAGGDVAFVKGQGALGLWGPSRKQGKRIGRHITLQSVSSEYEAHYFATRLYDLDCVFCGVLHDERARVFEGKSKKEGAWGYRRLVIQDGVLKGFLCIGERSENVRRLCRLWHTLLNDGTLISAIADQMLDVQFNLFAWIQKNNPLSPAQSLPTSQRTKSITVSPDQKILYCPYNKQKWRIKSEMTIGRGPQNMLVVQNEHSADSVDSISKSHAKIFWDKRRYVIQDLGSENGTYVSKRKISKPTPLRLNDEIKIGTAVFIFSPRIHESKEETIEQTARRIRHKTPVSVRYQDRSIPLEKEWTSLGKNPQSDIVFDDDSVSWNHAELLFEKEKLFLRDLGSSTGSFWNQKRVTIPVCIQESGIVRLGDVELTIQFGGSVQEKDTSSPIPKKEPIVQEKANMIVLSSQEGDQVIHKGSVLRCGRGKSNDWVIRNDSVSSNHAVIEWKDELLIRDRNSTNGVRINEQLIAPQKSCPLSVGDRLHLGDFVITVVQREESASVPEKASKHLVCCTASHSSEELYLEEGQKQIIGRNPRRAQWVMNDDSVSGEHCVIWLEKGNIYIQDVNSTNGTFVDGAHIGQKWVHVSSSQKIRIGESCIITIKERTL